MARALYIFFTSNKSLNLEILSEVALSFPYVRQSGVLKVKDAFDSAKTCKRQSVTAKREKSQTPKFVTALLT